MTEIHRRIDTGVAHADSQTHSQAHTRAETHTHAPAHAPAHARAGHPAYAHLHRRTEELLRRWEAPDDSQEGLRREFLAHLAAHPDAMEKAGPPAHFTASCLVVSPDRDRVLLTLHRKAGQWFQLGGHFEPADAGPLEAAAREAHEESGLAGLRLHPRLVQLDRHTLVGAFRRCREHLDLRYAAIAAPGSRPAVSAESLDVRWWPIDGLPAGSRQEISRLAAAALRALP
ncbi:MAG TPA: NUDIX domain-containing protein [Dermatophilaceae bacterium]|nr:NUDIX domain-containing protein [Dermatophilaceae bacterium]